MASVVIQKRQNKESTSYIVTYREPDTFKTKYYGAFSKKKDAVAAKVKLQLLIENGETPKVKVTNKSVLTTFKDLAEKQLAAWQIKVTRKELSVSTLDGYKAFLSVAVSEFRNRLICEIVLEDLLKFQEVLMRGFSPAYSNRIMFTIKQVFKLGVQSNAIAENLADRVRYISEKEHERLTFLSPSEIDALVEAARKTRAKTYIPVLIYLGVEHGSSRQEALDLKWKDIDLDFEGKGRISFYRTKNSNGRTNYLMPRSRRALREWKNHIEFMRHRKKIKVVDSAYVFCRLNGERITRFDSAWHTVCKVAGFDDLHFHDLRHTFCSNLLMSGATIKDVKEMIGHRDLAMTDRYTHLTMIHKGDVQKRLSAYYENGVG